MPDPRWLDRHAVAAYLTVPVDHLSRMVKSGKLPAPSTHLGRHKARWDKDEIDRLMRGADSSDDAAFERACNDILARPDRPSRSRGRDHQNVSVFPRS